MARISVYINERASKTNAINWEKELHKYLFRHEIFYFNPPNLERFKECLLDDLKNGTEYIFSIGGDGTANLITQYIALSDIKLMVIPTGTANDFANEVGTNINIKKIIKIFQKQSSKKIDLIKINDQYMFSDGGIGLAANVALKVNKYRKKHSHFKRVMRNIGANTYSLILGKELFLKPIKYYELRLTSDDLPLRNNTIVSPMVLINNQPVVGGKFTIAPNTKNDDGKFDVSIFLHKNKKELFTAILKIMFQIDVSDDKNLISFETNHLKLEILNKEKIPFFGDGEILVNDHTLDISILKKAINVCFYEDHLMLTHSYSLEEVSLT